VLFVPEELSFTLLMRLRYQLLVADEPLLPVAPYSKVYQDRNANYGKK
jgi:hypothetical protein